MAGLASNRTDRGNILKMNIITGISITIKDTDRGTLDQDQNIMIITDIIIFISGPHPQII